VRRPQVAIKTELQDDAGLADTALRGRFSHVGDLAKVALERACDTGGDRLGAGARQLRRPEPKWWGNRPVGVV